MNVTGMVHVNINCTDYRRSKAFYEMLGFEEVWQVPPTNSPEVNAAVGMQDYRVTGAIMALKGVEPAVLIDLLQWQAGRSFPALSEFIPAWVGPAGSSERGFAGGL